MIEIAFLIFFVRKLARIATGKGRSGAWGGLAVLFWFAGEVVGLMVGAEADIGMGAYLLALGCAALGATAAYFVVRSLRPGGLVAAWQADVARPMAPFGPPDLENPYAPPQTK